MPDDSIDWAALLKSANGDKSSSESIPLIISCNEGAGLTSMEYFSKNEQNKKQSDK